MGSAVLETERLAISLPGPSGLVPVVHDATFTVGEGEIVGLAGESGSGKSLTAQSLLNILPDGARVTGRATFEGRDLLGLDDRGWRDVRGNGIAMVFQDPSAALHPMLSIGRQITEHMQVHFGIRRAAADRRAIELLEQVRIPDPERALKAYPHQFSGGMRQRVAIAIALACRPRLLIADEPTTALDVTVQAGILALLDRLRSETGLSVLFITHDLGVLAALSTRTYVFYAGRVMETGSTGPLLLEPEHPYTAALLGARPHGQGSAAQLVPIPGSPVVPGEAPPGCPFGPRCSYHRADCDVTVPPLRPTGDGRLVACVVAERADGAQVREGVR